MRHLQKSGGKPFCHSERSTELTLKACPRTTENQAVISPFDRLRMTNEEFCNWLVFVKI